MPDISFIKNDGGSNTEPSHKKSFIPARFQKLLKYKWFVVGLGVVVILGFYALITKKQNSVEDVNSSDAGYLLDTYPEISGGSYTGLGSSGGGTTSNDVQGNTGNSNQEVIDTVNDNMDSYYDNVKGYIDSKMTDLSGTYDTTNESMTSNLDYLNEKVKEQDNTIAKQAEKINTDSIINAMKQNSELWNISSDSAQKQLYSDTNKKLAEQIGATFDSITGNWKDKNGNVLYYSNKQTSALNTVQTVTGKTASNQTTQDYINTMQSNSLKYKNATTDAERQALAKENETLGALAGLTKDSASGKWYTAGGSDAWDYTANYVNLTKDPNMPMGTRTVTTKTLPETSKSTTNKTNMFITESPFKPASSTPVKTASTPTKSNATYSGISNNKRNLPTVQETTVYNNPIAQNFLKPSKAVR